MLAPVSSFITPSPSLLQVLSSIKPCRFAYIVSNLLRIVSNFAYGKAALRNCDIVNCDKNALPPRLRPGRLRSSIRSATIARLVGYGWQYVTCIEHNYAQDIQFFACLCHFYAKRRAKLLGFRIFAVTLQPNNWQGL